MSLASRLREIASKPNEQRLALYQATATKVVADNQPQEVIELAKHRQ